MMIVCVFNCGQKILLDRKKVNTVTFKKRRTENLTFLTQREPVPGVPWPAPCSLVLLWALAEGQGSDPSLLWLASLVLCKTYVRSSEGCLSGGLLCYCRDDRSRAAISAQPHCEKGLCPCWPECTAVPTMSPRCLHD